MLSASPDVMELDLVGQEKDFNVCSGFNGRPTKRSQYRSHVTL